MWKVFFIILIATLELFTQSKPYYTFSELRGMEDNTGTTHLFYRLFYSNNSINNFYSNPVYHLDLNSGIDSAFLSSSSPDAPYYEVNDYDFWNNDPQKFIALTTYCSTECFAQIIKFDTTLSPRWFTLSSSGVKISVSPFNDSLIYALVPYMVKSTDGGKSWELSQRYYFAAYSPFDSLHHFVYDEEGDFLKTIDGGENYYLSDSLKDLDGRNGNSKIEFDQDTKHIYRITHQAGKYCLTVSDNYGNPFSWSIKYESENHFYVSVDTSQTGVIYLADGKRIYKSNDYGNTFNLFKEFDRKLVGIYKKPNSDKLYAATKYKLMEIENDSVKIIKQLKPDPEVFRYYPLSIGNRWTFKEYTRENDVHLHDYVRDYKREVTGDTLMENGFKYYIINDGEDYFYTKYYERIDSLEGKIYRYDIENPGKEYLIEDLLAEPGDTLFSMRFGPHNLMYKGEDNFTKWGRTYLRKTYEMLESLSIQQYYLAKDIGLDSIYIVFDFGHTEISVKGAILNGVLYGDTTIAGIEDDILSPKQFSLSQNYPNPFNPVTKIKYSISSQQYTTIKVFDILGNEIATLVNEEKPTGEYEVEFNGSGFASGVYFYTLKAGNFVQTKKLVMLK